MSIKFYQNSLLIFSSLKIKNSYFTRFPNDLLITIMSPEWAKIPKYDERSFDFEPIVIQIKKKKNTLSFRNLNHNIKLVPFELKHLTEIQTIKYSFVAIMNENPKVDQYFDNQKMEAIGVILSQSKSLNDILIFYSWNLKNYEPGKIYNIKDIYLKLWLNWNEDKNYFIKKYQDKIPLKKLYSKRINKKNK